MKVYKAVNLNDGLKFRRKRDLEQVDATLNGLSSVSSARKKKPRKKSKTLLPNVPPEITGGIFIYKNI